MDTTKEIVLIIEDDLGLSELINERIQQAGFDTFTVFSAHQALVWLKVHTPTLILLDYSLPDMNGKEFLKHLNSEIVSIPPFMVATGQGDERIAVEMMKLGAKDYVLKDSNFLEMIPIVITKIIEVIKSEQLLQRTELELKESYMFNKQIIEGAQEGIVVFDRDMRYKVFNPYMERMTGVPEINVIGKRPQDVFPTLIGSGVIAIIERALQGEIFAEKDIQFKIPDTGKSGWNSDKTAPLFSHSGNIIGVITTIHDITERKATEKALLESQQRFSLAIQATQDGIWERDLTTNETIYSPRWCEILGYSYNDLELPHTYQSWSERIHPNDYDRVIEALNNHIEKGTEYKVEYRHLHKSGEYRWQKSTGTSVLDKDGKAIKIVGCISDISERKKTEIALRENEEKFRNIFENSIVGKSITTIDGKLVVNNAFRNIVGYSSAELSNMTWREFTHKDDIEYNAKEIKSLLKGEKHFSQWEKRYIHKNGSIIWVHISIALLRDNEGNPIHFISEIYDITERKQAEQTLEDKMDEMLNFHRLTVGRELTMIELKKEVNELQKQLGFEPKYHIVK